MKCNALELVRMLLEKEIDCNLVNQEGQSPLSLALKGNACPELSESILFGKPIWSLLLEHSADTNIVYPEESHDGTANGLNTN